MVTEKVVITIPTYNEALVIKDTLSEVFKATAVIPNKDIHVLVFDSNSSDETQSIIKTLQHDNDHLHLITEPQKSGLGSAYFQAMHYAMHEMGADIIIEFDADLSHQPQYLAPMLDKITNYDVVLGSRYVQGGSIPKDWGWHRKLFSIVGNLIARLALTMKYKDFTSGFKVTRSNMLQKALPKEFISKQYAYKIELLWLLHQQKARIIEHPIDFIDRKQGVSKLPANSIFDSLRVLFIIRFRRFIRYFKMCIVGLSGMLIQYIIYNVLRESMSPFHAIQAGVAGAAINNFLLNNHFTFKKKSTSHRAEHLKAFILFIGYSALMMNFQGYWLDKGISYFGRGPLKENLIIFTGIIAGSIFNYLIYSKIIWRQRLLRPS